MSTTHWHIAYDIADPKRLPRVERALTAVGDRLHFSLFSCEMTGEELVNLQTHLARLIDVRVDQVRYTPLCGFDRAGSRHLGISAEPSLPSSWVV